MTSSFIITNSKKQMFLVEKQPTIKIKLFNITVKKDCELIFLKRLLFFTSII